VQLFWWFFKEFRKDFFISPFAFSFITIHSHSYFALHSSPPSFLQDIILEKSYFSLPLLKNFLFAHTDTHTHLHPKTTLFPLVLIGWGRGTVLGRSETSVPVFLCLFSPRPSSSSEAASTIGLLRAEGEAAPHFSGTERYRTEIGGDSLNRPTAMRRRRRWRCRKERNRWWFFWKDQHIRVLKELYYGRIWRHAQCMFALNLQWWYLLLLQERSERERKVVPVLNKLSHWRRMGQWMYGSTYSWPRHWLEVSGQLHAPVALPPGKSPPSTLWIGGWMGCRTCLDDVERKKNLAPTGTRTRTLGWPARSKSLYRLRHNILFGILG
jgi:hypothetical protein